MPFSPAEFGATVYSTLDNELLSRTLLVAVRYHLIEVTLRIVEQRRVPLNPTTMGLSYPTTSRAERERERERERENGRAGDCDVSS